MARDYRQLYQHMAQSSSELMPDMPAQDNPFNYRLTESEADNDQAPVKCHQEITQMVLRVYSVLLMRKKSKFLSFITSKQCLLVISINLLNFITFRVSSIIKFLVNNSEQDFHPNIILIIYLSTV